MRSASARAERNHRAGRFAVGPHVHVAVVDSVGAEDRAYVSAVIVAVMHCLNEHYAKVDLLAPVAVLGLGHLAADQASGHLDELIPAALSQFAQRTHTRKRIALVELRLVS